jgi:MOSC domain-containing protein YiiM
MSRLNGDGARVLHLFVKPGHRMEMRPVTGVTAVQGKGLEGDAAFGRARRQVLLVDLQNLTDLGLHPGDVRENVTLDGLPLDRLVTGSHLLVGEALLEITDECTPCERMDEIQPGLQAQLRGRRGVLARVVRGGSIRLGDSARITPEPQANAESAPGGFGTHEEAGR